MSERKLPVGNRPLQNVESIDSAKQYLRERGLGPDLDRMEARHWWQKPLYWDLNDEPQFIGDLLFTLFALTFPFFAAFGLAVAAVGFDHLATVDGWKTDAIIGLVLTAVWWYALYRCK